MKNDEKIINQLIDGRVNSGYTQQQFADILGIKKSNLSRIENNKENFSYKFLMKMINSYTYYFNLRTEFPDPNCELYTLKQFDFDLLTFKFTDNGLNGQGVEIISINKELKKLLPKFLKPSNESLLNFLNQRSIPKNRKYVENILFTQGLNIGDLKGIIDVCMGLSLNDSYWITKANFKGRFSDYNLYENDFSNALALVAYTGNSTSPISITTSPEFTTGGMLPKAWRRFNNKVYLYKGNSDFYKTEATTEFLCSQILDVMGIPHVTYELEKWKGLISSKCEVFTTPSTSYVSIGKFKDCKTIKGCLDFYKNLSKKDFEHIKSMLAFDCLVYNEDRHYGNFGVLINNSTNSISSAAPVFDNGCSLFNKSSINDLNNIMTYRKTRTNPYGISFDVLAKNVIGPTQIKQLEKLKNFEFKRNELISFSEKRIEMLEEFIRFRVDELIKIAKDN